VNSRVRTSLVTGSNRGIGAGIALRLAADGADVAINYLEGEAEAEAIAAQIRALGRRALLVPADLRDPQALAAMMDCVLQTFGTLDILVNNAGVGIFSTFLETSLQTWTETMDTNLRAAFLCSQIAARAMAARKFGRIVHITSTGSQVAIPQLAHYCASKAGLDGCRVRPAGHHRQCHRAEHDSHASERRPARYRGHGSAGGRHEPDRTYRHAAGYRRNGCFPGIGRGWLGERAEYRGRWWPDSALPAASLRSGSVNEPLHLFRLP